jgi:hypothetical protein
MMDRRDSISDERQQGACGYHRSAPTGGSAMILPPYGAGSKRANSCSRPTVGSATGLRGDPPEMGI